MVRGVAQALVRPLGEQHQGLLRRPRSGAVPRTRRERQRNRAAERAQAPGIARDVDLTVRARGVTRRDNVVPAPRYAVVDALEHRAELARAEQQVDEADVLSRDRHVDVRVALRGVVPAVQHDVLHSCGSEELV